MLTWLFSSLIIVVSASYFILYSPYNLPEMVNALAQVGCDQKSEGWPWPVLCTVDTECSLVGLAYFPFHKSHCADFSELLYDKMLPIWIHWDPVHVISHIFPLTSVRKIGLDPASLLVSCLRLWSKCEVKNLEVISSLYNFSRFAIRNV